MESQRLLNKMIGVGLTEEPFKAMEFTDEPKTPCFITIPNENARNKYISEDVGGQGHHPDETCAKIKSVGECLERLCLFNPGTKELDFSIASDIDIAIFNCYSEEQLEDKNKWLKKLRQGRYKLWPAKDCFKKKNLNLPAQLFFLNIGTDEVSIRGERISTGTALGLRGTDEAFKRGFLEVVERDSFITSYLKQRIMHEIINLPEKVRSFLEYLERYRLEAHLYDATTDLGIPTVIAIVFDRTGIGPAVNIGAKADFDFENAMFGALLESVQPRRPSRFKKESNPNFAFPKEAYSMENRYYYWYNPERLHDIDFWIGSCPKINYSRLSEMTVSLNKAMDELKSRGYHVFLGDLTLPEIRRAGFEVIKVLIPELHPLYLSERHKALYSVHAGQISDNPALKPHPFS